MRKLFNNPSEVRAMQNVTVVRYNQSVREHRQELLRRTLPELQEYCATVMQWVNVTDDVPETQLGCINFIFRMYNALRTSGMGE